VQHYDKPYRLRCKLLHCPQFRPSIAPILRQKSKGHGSAVAFAMESGKAGYSAATGSIEANRPRLP
jgi:hypothetical protein